VQVSQLPLRDAMEESVYGSEIFEVVNVSDRSILTDPVLEESLLDSEAQVI